MKLSRKFQIALSVMVLAATLMTIKLDYIEAGGNKVLFDEGHGQKFLLNHKGPLGLSDVSSLFQEVGIEVVANKGAISEEKLADVNAIIISGAFKPFGPTEIRAIKNFVEQGGRLCVMLHIGFPVVNLLKELQVFVSNGVVHEQENLIHEKDIDFYVTTAGQHELVEGVHRFKIFGGWALMSKNKDAVQIASTTEEAWVDLNRNKKFDAHDRSQSFSLAIAGKLGNGEFVVFGDDAIFQNTFLTEGNRELGTNLAKWLLKGKPVQAPERAFL